MVKHNGKLLKQSEGEISRPPPEFNCQKSKVKDCPLPGCYNQEGVVYQATVTNSRGDAENLVGLAKKN